MLSNEERMSKSLNESREAYLKRLKERLGSRRRRDGGNYKFESVGLLFISVGFYDTIS